MVEKRTTKIKNKTQNHHPSKTNTRDDRIVGDENMNETVNIKQSVITNGNLWNHLLHKKCHIVKNKFHNQTHTLPLSRCPGVPLSQFLFIPVSLCPSVLVSQCPSVPVSWVGFGTAQGGYGEMHKGGRWRNAHFLGLTDIQPDTHTYRGSYRAGAHLKMIVICIFPC